MTSKSRWQNDSGASLLIVLVFMLLISIVTLSLLSFTQASFEGSDAVRVSRQTTYSLDAVTELGINKVVSPSGADYGTSYGPPCAFALAGVNGQSTTVDCRPAPNSGEYLPNRAINALLTLSPTGALTLTGTHELFVDGRIYSKNTILAGTSNNNLLRSSATIIAQGDGDCTEIVGGGGSAEPRVLGARGTFCSAAATTAGNKPTWGPAASSAPPLAALPTFTCQIGNNGNNDPIDLVTFTEGTYVPSSITTFKTLALANGCGDDATLYFSPGVYYFSDVTFDMGDYNIVAGRATGNWLSNRKAAPTDGSACDNGGTEATQFILGGSSQIRGTATNKTPVFTICAGPRPSDKPAIAIYGLDSNLFGLSSVLTSATALITDDKPSVFVRGMVYLPNSNATLSLHNKSRTIFDGGMVLSTLTADISASTKQIDSPISLPDCTPSDPCRGDRRVIFTARSSSGSNTLRSVVQFDNDGGDPADATSDLERWSLLDK